MDPLDSEMIVRLMQIVHTLEVRVRRLEQERLDQEGLVIEILEEVRLLGQEARRVWSEVADRDGED
jgi:hypothetical protein